MIWRHVNQIGFVKAMQTFTGPYTRRLLGELTSYGSSEGGNGSREEDWFRAESELSHSSEVLPADTAAEKDFCEFSQR